MARAHHELGLRPRLLCVRSGRLERFGLWPREEDHGTLPNMAFRFQVTAETGDEDDLLGSGETASVAMDILEPAPGIVGYDFGFR